MNKNTSKIALAGATILLALVPAAASAATVTLNGLVANMCVLTLSTPGLIAVTPQGTEVSTTQAGGLAATMSVVATGTNPTLSFGAPTLSGPSAAGATTELAFTSPGGATRDFASTDYSVVVNRLLDTVTINGRARNAGGFASGSYSIASNVTCTQ